MAYLITCLQIHHSEPLYTGVSPIVFFQSRGLRGLYPVYSVWDSKRPNRICQSLLFLLDFRAPHIMGAASAGAVNVAGAVARLAGGAAGAEAGAEAGSSMETGRWRSDWVCT